MQDAALPQCCRVCGISSSQHLSWRASHQWWSAGGGRLLSSFSRYCQSTRLHKLSLAPTRVRVRELFLGSLEMQDKLPARTVWPFQSMLREHPQRGRPSSRWWYVQSSWRCISKRARSMLRGGLLSRRLLLQGPDRGSVCSPCKKADTRHLHQGWAVTFQTPPRGEGDLCGSI